MKRKNIPRPFNGGTWTEARKHAFIKSALRRAQWPQKYQAIKDAFVCYGINPETNRKVKLHRCADCQGLFMANKMHADHKTPVVPLTGFDSWDGVIDRLYCEAYGFDVLCEPCHKVRTDKENRQRRENKEQ